MPVELRLTDTRTDETPDGSAAVPQAPAGEQPTPYPPAVYAPPFAGNAIAAAGGVRSTSQL